jgi:hypothetical protein
MFSELNFKIMIKAAGAVAGIWIVMVLAITALGG